MPHPCDNPVVRPPLAVLIFVALAGACGGGGDTADSGAPFAPAARELIPEALLTPDDLPDGWDAIDEEDDISNRVRFSGACDIFDLGVVFPGAAASQRSPAYIGPSNEQALSFAAIFEDEADSATAIDGTRELVDECGEEYKDEVERLARDELSALGVSLGLFADIDVSLVERDVPAPVDESAAYRVQVKIGIVGTDQRFTIDVIVSRWGRTAVGLVYAVFGEPNELEEGAIAEALLARAATVDEQLPESDG